MYNTTDKSHLKLGGILCALSVVSRCHVVGRSAVQGNFPIFLRLIIACPIFKVQIIIINKELKCRCAEEEMVLKTEQNTCFHCRKRILQLNESRFGIYLEDAIKAVQTT